MPKIGRLPYLYFLLLPHVGAIGWRRLEDCRIYTSFYYVTEHSHGNLIGRLPYLYFLLLGKSDGNVKQDWKTAVFILPFTIGS